MFYVCFLSFFITFWIIMIFSSIWGKLIANFKRNFLRILSWRKNNLLSCLRRFNLRNFYVYLDTVYRLCCCMLLALVKKKSLTTFVYTTFIAYYFILYRSIILRLIKVIFIYKLIFIYLLVFWYFFLDFIFDVCEKIEGNIDGILNLDCEKENS